MATKKSTPKKSTSKKSAPKKSAPKKSSSKSDVAQKSAATNDATGATVAGLGEDASVQAIEIMQERLVALLDLSLTLKHIHWNVVGMNFIAIHEMLDPQVDAVRLMSDAVAERIATLGGEPKGTPGASTSIRTWDDYELNRQPSVRHLVELDSVYSGVIEDHRAAQSALGDPRSGLGGSVRRTSRRPRTVPVVRPSPPQGRRRRRVAPPDVTGRDVTETAPRRHLRVASVSIGHGMNPRRGIRP